MHVNILLSENAKLKVSLQRHEQIIGELTAENRASKEQPDADQKKVQ